MGNGAMSGGKARRGRREKGQHAASLPGTANLWVQPAGHSHAGTYARGARTDSRANASETRRARSIAGAGGGNARGGKEKVEGR